MPRMHSETGKYRAMTPAEIAGFFDDNVSPVPMSGCWIWTGHTTRAGYPQLRGEYMHRYSYERHVGPIPEGLHVLHKCDVPSCVNPAHLFVGTAGDNAADKVRKGRARGGSLAGERHPMRKIGADEVRQIRDMLTSGTSQWDIAKQFGITQSAVSCIKRGKSWASVQ